VKINCFYRLSGPKDVDFPHANVNSIIKSQQKIKVLLINIIYTCKSQLFSGIPVHEKFKVGIVRHKIGRPDCLAIAKFSNIEAKNLLGIHFSLYQFQDQK
jgi:hypothetical protein